MKQTYQPYEVIVTSDSYINAKNERKYIENLGFTYLNNERTKNLAGNLNNAINYIVKKNLTSCLNNVYIATLDDDDWWDETYLEKCYNQVIKEKSDLVISGLNYIQNNKIKTLTILERIEPFDFLTHNKPHLQGSNTFVKLTKVLESGCFDENLNATIDRDFFIRLFFLNPKYSIIKEHLVYIDANNQRPRITNKINIKKKSLIQFYLKWSSLFSNQQKIEFFLNCKNRLNISLSKNEIKKFINLSNNNNKDKTNYHIKNININQNNYRIVIGVICSSLMSENHIINQVLNLNLNNYYLVILQNYSNSKKYINNKYIYTFNYDDYIRNEQIKALINNVFEINIKNKKINDICVARTVLQIWLKKTIFDNDVIWIIDDDMIIENKKNDLLTCINSNINKCDCVIGSYENEPPVCLLTTLRTNLVDYWFKHFINKKMIF